MKIVSPFFRPKGGATWETEACQGGPGDASGPAETKRAKQIGESHSMSVGDPRFFSDSNSWLPGLARSKPNAGTTSLGPEVCSQHS